MVARDFFFEIICGESCGTGGNTSRYLRILLPTGANISGGVSVRVETPTGTNVYILILPPGSKDSRAFDLSKI